MRVLVLPVALAAIGCSELLDLDRFENAPHSSSTAGSGAGGAGGAGSASSARAASSGAGGITGCGGAPVGSFYVFVSATGVTPVRDFNSVASAHDLCGRWATAAGLPGVWSAWLSETGYPATAGLMPAPGPWYGCDGKLTVRSVGTLPILAEPIDVDEFGRPGRTGYAWTGTRANLALGEHCTDWDAGGSPDLGTAGAIGEGTSGWTDSLDLECDGNYSLYCFQKE